MARPRTAVATLAVALVALAPLAGCGSETAAPGASGKTLVVATTTQLADFARVVGGDDVEVYGLLRANLDAHDFEPSPADLDAIARADVILENGLGLDAWVDDAVEASGTDVEPVDTSEGAKLLAGTEEEHAAGEQHGEGDGHDHDGDWNPHVWFTPTNAAVMVGHVADALVAAVPADAEAFRDRRAAYDRQLAELDRWIAAQVDELDDKDLVTDHDAFPYFIDRYGLTFVGSIIPSFDTSVEISPADLNDLADAIEETGVKAIFTERSLPAKSAEALARTTGVEVVSGDDGLYGDSLGPDGSDGDTYLKMMRHNTTTIVEHLR